MTKESKKRIRVRPLKRERIRDSTTISGRALTTREELFVQNYTLLLNQTAAVYAAGIASKEKDTNHRARQLGYQMMKDPDVQNAIQLRLEYLAARCNITKQRVTSMMMDIYDSARREGDQNVAHRVAADVAKLHGLMITQTRAEFVWRLEDMSEDELIKFLGKRYNPKLTEKLSKDAVDGELV